MSDSLQIYLQCLEGGLLDKGPSLHVLTEEEKNKRREARRTHIGRRA